MQEDESYLNKRGLTHFWENIDALKQDKLTAGANITIASDNTISASQPTVNDATLTIQKEGTSVGTFTANASTNSTVNIIETDPTVPAWAKASSKPTYTWTEITNRPTNVSAFTNDAGYLTSVPTATTNSLGVVQVGSGLAISSGGVLSATGGGTADDVAWGHITGTMADQTDLTNALAAKADSSSLAAVATSGSYNDLTNTPTIGNATLTIQKNGTSAGTFTANATSNKSINITVPTTAADVSALPASTKYGASIAVSINTTDYKVTTTLKDQDGNTLGTAQVIDLPLESVVVNGSYDSTNKKIVLTLQSGSTIDIPVADLVAGLQSEITAQNMLSSDLVDDTNHTHKFVTAAQITKLNGIATGAEVNQNAFSNVKVGSTTVAADAKTDTLELVAGSNVTLTPDATNDKVTIAATDTTYSDATTSASGLMSASDKTKLNGIAAGAEVNVQSDWNQTTTTADDYIKNKPTIPTVNNATLTITQNGTSVGTFTANASSNKTIALTDTTYSDATTSASGLMSASDKTKLNGIASGAEVNVQSDWNQTTTTADDYIKNKPTLATVATSGSYNDLSNKPTIPTVNNATLTIKHNGASQGTFTANASSNSTIDIKAVKYIDLSSTAQTNSWRRTVIGLCEVSTTNNTGKDSFSSGRIVMHRDNGLAGAVEINIQIENQYSNAYYTNVAWYANLKLLPASADIDTAKGFRPCTFKYNNVWYGGIEVFVDNAQLGHVAFEGDTNFAVFALDYYQVPHEQTASVILNQEVYDSLNYSQWALNKGKEFFNNIDLYTGSMTKNDTYTYTFPNKTGTVAMTSDIPTVNNGQLTIQKNGSNVATFTANQSGNATANISVPTKTSDITNDSDFTTTATAQEFAIGQGSTQPVFDDMTPVRTIEWDVADTTYRPIYQMANTGWTYINMDITVAYRITVTGTNINSVTDVVDRWINPASYPLTSMVCRTLSNSAATTGLKYLRAVYPTSSYLNNTTYPLGVEVEMHNTTARHIKVEVFKDNSQVTWNATKPSGSIYVNSTYNGNRNLEVYATRGWRFHQPSQMYANSAGQASYIADFEAANIAAGELKTGATALVAGHYAFLADDGFVYDISDTTHNIAMGESKVGFMNSAVAANTAISWTYWRTISRPSATQVGYFQHDTLALGDRVFLRCTMDSGGNIHSDNYLSTTMSPNYTWMPFGWARSASQIYVDTRFPMFYTIDANGKMTHINGKELAGSGAGAYSAGDHIDITNGVISAEGYVHSENPVSTQPVTPIITGSMISNGTITADKLATGATIKLTLSTSDPGEGSALAANTLYGVYI